jgi:hypothetical protein
MAGIAQNKESAQQGDQLSGHLPDAASYMLQNIARYAINVFFTLVSQFIHQKALNRVIIC